MNASVSPTETVNMKANKCVCMSLIVSLNLSVSKILCASSIHKN